MSMNVVGKHCKNVGNHIVDEKWNSCIGPDWQGRLF